MKSFIASLLVFLLLFILIIWNRAFVCEAMDSLEYSLEALTFSTVDKAKMDALEENWKQCEKLLSFSINYVEPEKLNEYILRMRAAFDTADESEWEAARLMALETARRIRELEQITTENLL